MWPDIRKYVAIRQTLGVSSFEPILTVRIWPDIFNMWPHLKALV